MEQPNSTMLSQDHQTYVMHIGALFLKVYASLLLILGIPANILCGIIMGRNRSNRMTTRVLMVILSVADSAVLLVAVLRYWMMSVLKWDPRQLGSIECKVHSFSVGITSDYAIGALCALAVERLLVVAFPHMANSIVNMHSVTRGMIGLGLMIIAKNIPTFWLIGLTQPRSTDENNMLTPPTNNTFDCASLSIYQHIFKIFSKIDFVSFAVVPYIILFSSNLFIYLKLRKQKALLRRGKPKPRMPVLPAQTETQPVQNNSMSKEENRPFTADPNQSTMVRFGPKIRTTRRPDGVIKLLTALTLIHVVCTLPGTLFTFIASYPKNLISMRKDGQELLKSGLVLLVFTNNAINFFGYYASSTAFRESFHSIFKWESRQAYCKLTCVDCWCCTSRNKPGSESVQLVVNQPNNETTKPTEMVTVKYQPTLKDSQLTLYTTRLDDPEI